MIPLALISTVALVALLAVAGPGWFAPPEIIGRNEAVRRLLEMSREAERD